MGDTDRDTPVATEVADESPIMSHSPFGAFAPPDPAEEQKRQREYHRAHSLELAVRSVEGQAVTATDILARARQFAAFIFGEEATDGDS